MSPNEQLMKYGWNADLERASNELIQEGMEPARVAAVDRGSVALYTADGDRRGVPRTGVGELATGDWVIAGSVPPDDLAPIVHLLPRRTKLSRKVAGKRTIEQTLVANVDTIFVVSGLDDDFNARRIERYLSLAWGGGAHPVLVLTKADLSPDVSSAVEAAEAVAVGVPVHAVSNLSGDGLDALRPYLQPGITLATVGSSGAGKSTLINALTGSGSQLVRELGWYGKGQHTTTRRELIQAPSGALLIDTPGLREVGLWDAEAGLGSAFADIDELAQACRFRDCEHQGEPGCAVAGAVPEERLASFHKLRREARSVTLRADKAAARREARKFGRLVKRDAY